MACIQNCRIHGQCTKLTNTWPVLKTTQYMACVQNCPIHGLCTKLPDTWPVYKTAQYIIKLSGTTQNLYKELPNTWSSNRDQPKACVPNCPIYNQTIKACVPNCPIHNQTIKACVPNCPIHNQTIKACVPNCPIHNQTQGVCTKLPNTQSDSGRVSLDQAHCEPRHVGPEWLSGVHWGVLQVEHGAERLCDIALRRLAVWLQIPPALRVWTIRRITQDGWRNGLTLMCRHATIVFLSFPYLN